LEITNSKNARKNVGQSKIGEYTYMKFGDDDKLFDEILADIQNNDFMPTLLQTSVEFLHGAGLGLFEERIETGADGRKKRIIEPAQNAEMEEWAERVNLKDFWLKACYQFVYSSNLYTVFDLSATGQVAKLSILDFPNVRSEVQNPETGDIDHYFVFSERKKNGEVIKYEAIPRYYTGIEEKTPQFLFHAKLPTPGQAYYGVPAYYGALKTIKLLNQIPEFHLSGIENGYNVKFHVKVPDVYLDQFDTEEEKKKEWEKLQKDMDEQLAGKDNVNKTILTKFIVDKITGKPLPGFEIGVIENNNTHEAYLKLQTDFRINATGSVGIHPGLANIDTGGKLGGTASEMRVAGDMHLKLHTPIPRQRILRPIEIARNLNGFPKNLFWAPIDVELQTLDKNPTGKQNVVSNAN
jgi:hypothetical protein